MESPWPTSTKCTSKGEVGSGEASICVAVSDGTREDEKEAVGISGLLEIGAIVKVEAGFPISEGLGVAKAGAARLIIDGICVRTIQQQHRTNSKGITVTIFPVRPDFQKLEILWTRLLPINLIEDVIEEVEDC